MDGLLVRQAAMSDDLKSEILRELLSQLVTRTELAELELPHVVISTDPGTGQFSCSGPFPDALAALSYAEEQGAIDRGHPEDPLLRHTVAALFPPEPSSP